jgi:acetate kinase
MAARGTMRKSSHFIIHNSACPTPKMDVSRMTDTLLLLNAGSSSLKFALYPPDGERRHLYAAKSKNLAVRRCSVHVTTLGDAITDQKLEANADIGRCLEFLLRWLGAEIDESANRVHQTIISTITSKIVLCVIPTNEEAVTARNTAQVLGLDAKC